ncbi:MAG TPA: hypothetical protein VGH19_04145 [Verrucomicrobiae bacterium]
MSQKNSSPYPVTPIAYYKRFIRNVNLHNQGQDKSYLLYAALELRYTIEALLFYYLHALSEGDLSKSKQKLYRPQDLRQAILAADPLFLVKLEFADMCAYFDDSISSQLRPDIALLTSIHGRLGDWLHAEYSPLCSRVPEEKWVELSKLFESLGDHLSVILSHPLLDVNLTDKGNLVMQQYIEGTLTKAEVIDRLNKEWNLLVDGVTQHIITDE